ncbi:MAG TPA: DUF87 domain-containing protein [Kofleriaceae bacterium]|nr:DUF87 domain-containing protein [Kofleriaceae bacterium]
MDREQLGAFYLGTTVDPLTGVEGEPVMLESRDLTTHAVCVGMTGSGKTGLCLALVEEALLDGVPVIAIDPKGDLGNLMLTFPDLAAADFEPWIDPGEAQREGVTPGELAGKTAARWRAGLAASGQGPERIARLRAAGEVAIFTPGSDAGLPLSVLRSFRAPAAGLVDDAEAWRDRIEASASGVLGLVGIAADPLRSREHVLVSQLLDRAWREGRDLDLADLIQGVSRPPFEKVGALDLETFFPAKERTELALALNTLLASPSFGAWLQGQPLDIPSLLYTAAGRPRVAVLSIAHLGDAERMFFVTLLLQEVASWMRTQAGTTSLRAIVFMDEVSGYLPPVAAPPSKKPMLTLLKQARAFGVGMVVATQNPIDLDYKALSNAGTWFLGRLQTERDQQRVLDGLEGASATAGQAFDRAAMQTTLAGLASRMFVMNNVHDDHPIVLKSRFVMSYLAGPLTRPQIQRLMAPAQAAAPRAPAPVAAPATTRPVVPPGIDELFAGRGLLSPSLLGIAKLHHVDAKAGIDVWREVAVVAPLDEGSAGDLWEAAAFADPALGARAVATPPEGASYAPLPAGLTAKAVGRLDDELAAWLHRNGALTVLSAPSLELVATAGETEAAFRARVAIVEREARDAAVDRLRARYRARLEALDTKEATAERRIERERAQARAATADSAISVGATVLGALFGGTRRGTLSRAATAARRASRTAEQHGDIAQATEAADEVRARRAALEAEIAAEVAALTASATAAIEPREIPVRKSDTAVTRVALLWRPRP